MKAYTFTSLGDAVANVASWVPAPDRSVLLVHDMQKFFLEPIPPHPRTELVNNCVQLVQRARLAGVPIAYTAQPGSMSPEQRGLLRDIWGPGMDAGPDHRGIVDALLPRTGERVLTKWRYSAFFSTELGDILAEEGRDQLIICGVYAHVGILATALESYSRDVQTFIVRDAVADFSAADHEMALSYAATCCAVVLDTDQVPL
jgi:isochorismate hydrolase